MTEEQVAKVAEEPIVEAAPELDLESRFSKLKEEVMDMYKPQDIEENNITPMTEETVKKLMQEHTLNIRKELENASPQSHRVGKPDESKVESMSQLREIFEVTQQYDIDKKNSYVKEALSNVSNQGVKDLILDTVKDMKYHETKNKIDELTKLYELTDSNKPYHMYNNGKSESENVNFEAMKAIKKMSGSGGFSDYNPKP